jgi:hypothetical protein
MTDTALFIGWGTTIPGREHHAMKLYEETLELFDAAVKAGDIEGYEPVLLGPHGGELEGFFLVRGSLDKLVKFQTREDLEHLRIKAQAFKTNFGIVFATTGDLVKRSYELSLQIVDEVVKEPIGV